MSTILAYVALQNGKPTRSSLETLTRACQIAAERGATLAATVVTDGDPAAAVAEAGRHGAATVYVVRSAALAAPLNAPVLAALDAVLAAARPSVVVFPSTEGVKDVLGALAVRTGGAALPDVAAFEWTADGAVEARRPVMAAKFLARVRADSASPEAPVLVSVRAGSYEAAEAPVEAAVVDVPLAFDAAGGATLREVVSSAAGAVDLADARVVVAAGRGVKDEAAKALVLDLADALGAAVGASRAVVESGLFPATAQIGQTGKVVSPDLYVGVGISGAVQHVAGMANARVIVAINQNPDAPIFGVATYGIVGDLYRVLPPFIEAVRQHRAA